MSAALAPTFSFEKVSKSFGSVRALADVSFEVPAGKTSVFLGPSGSGKSTALRMLLGLIAPDTGKVLYRGQPLLDAAAREQRRTLGYGVQGGGLFPHLTAQDNVVLPAQVLRWEKARIQSRVEELLGLVRLPTDALARFPAELSGGQAQRVALMRALILDPDVLILDEPLGALDPDTRFDLQQDLHAVFSQLRRTVVLVTHDLGEAYFLGEHWVILRDGRVIQAGLPSDVLAHPGHDFVGRFLGAQRAVPPVGSVSR